MQIDEKCLNNTVVDDFYFITDYMEGKCMFKDTLEFVFAVSEVMDDCFNMCGYYKIVSDLENFCHFAACDFNKILKNSMDKVF
jgi:hypothetical protein